MSDSTSENQENILKWAIRYVLIPVTLAVMAGYFALEVVQRQHELQDDQPIEINIDDIFATMTAVPNNQPTAVPEAIDTPTIQPTPTQEAAVEESGDFVAKVPPQSGSPAGSNDCSYVPVGWGLYTVQPGNTLYSLARQTGTTIEMIRQVNCLYGELMAFTQIWLPNVAFDEVEPPADEPTVTVTPTVTVDEPAVTITPTITVTEPATLTPTVTVTEPAPAADLLNGTGNWPTLQQTCGLNVCFVTVGFAVNNAGSASAGGFNVSLQFDSKPFVTLDQFVTGLAPGDSEVFSLTSLELNNCYAVGCTVCINVDSRNSVAEENEENNQYCETFQGHGTGG